MDTAGHCLASKITQLLIGCSLIFWFNFNFRTTKNLMEWTSWNLKMFLVKVNFQMPSQESKVSIDTGRYYSQPSRRKTLESSSIWPVNPISSSEKWKWSPSLWRRVWPLLLASNRAFPVRIFHRCGWQDLSPEETRNRRSSRLPVGGISICHRSIWCTTVSTTNTYKCNYENYWCCLTVKSTVLSSRVDPITTGKNSGHLINDQMINPEIVSSNNEETLTDKAGVHNTSSGRKFTRKAIVFPLVDNFDPHQLHVHSDNHHQDC